MASSSRQRRWSGTVPRGSAVAEYRCFFLEFPFDYGKSLVDFCEQRDLGWKIHRITLLPSQTWKFLFRKLRFPKHGSMEFMESEKWWVFQKEAPLKWGPFSASMLVFGGVDDRLKYEAYIIHQSKALLNQESKSHHIMFNASHANKRNSTFIYVTFAVGGNFAPPTCAANKLLDFFSGLKSWALPMKCLAIRSGEGSMMRKDDGSDGSYLPC